MGVGLLIPLIVASQLPADPRGWGTHEQLGLPPCTFLTLTGKRCPACGMTTSWALMTQGHPLAAMRTHASGTLLSVVTLGVALGALAIAGTGRWPAWMLSDRGFAGASVVLAGLVMLEWVLRVLVA